MARMLEPALGDSRAMTIYGRYRGGTWRGFIVGCASLRIAMIVPPEQRLVCLS